MCSQLREFDRARQLYQKYLEFDPTNSAAWIKYAELETQLQDFVRARAIFELAISQPQLSMPELLWKAYIDFEYQEGERDRARSLYDRLVTRSGHYKAWIAFALFEAASIPAPREVREEAEDQDEVPDVPGDAEAARKVFDRAYKDLKSRGLKEERVRVLEAWKTFEEEHGTANQVADVQAMMPVVSKRRRRAENGIDEEDCTCSDPLTTLDAYGLVQTGTLCSPTTSARRIPRRSSSSRWRICGRRRRQAVASSPLCPASSRRTRRLLLPRSRSKRKMGIAMARTSIWTKTPVDLNSCTVYCLLVCLPVYIELRSIMIRAPVTI